MPAENPESPQFLYHQGDFYLSTMKPCCQDGSFTDDGPFTLYSQLGNMFNIFLNHTTLNMSYQDHCDRLPDNRRWLTD